ncbi:TRAP transporter substrate-binding protein [Aquibium sp. A9E412]|uniref:TRAP transporter substrate-binding protein n=1 Tax=Aquibium sp. A9E412 TaxID=2976767 RepID=UPI0025AFEDA2|nr:TRAP transporter substrate-binding protein [Aquibium sp. A9E412]MDN2568065.1 TRAP transporter substrate-binding protein [Aquibium sp. A9E412]
MTTIKRLTMAAVVLGAAFAQPALADSPVVLKFASAFPPGTKTNALSIPAFIEAVEEASEGTLKIEHYPGGTLGASPTTQLKLVEDGVVDIAEVVASYTPGRFPELEMFELPFVFESTREASLTAYALYEKGLFSGFDDLELVGIAEVGPYYLHSKSEVASVDDISGLKLRAGGPVQGAVVSAMGGVPVGGMPATQIAENISRNVVDGTLMDIGNMFNFRIADAAEYHVVNAPLGNVAVMFPMRKETYESLPPKAKAAFDKYRGMWFSEVLAENLDAQNQESLERLEADPEHTMVEFSDADIATLKDAFSGLKERWDSETDGVNLYQEMLAARDAVRAGE